MDDMEIPGNEPQQIQPKSNWLHDTLRGFNFVAVMREFVAVMRERNQIRRICERLLGLYRQVEFDMPQASPTERYARVIEQSLGADPSTVRKILRRTAESFAAWPVERPLIFRDVVQYIAVTDGLKIDIAVDGVRSRIVDVVLAVAAEVIPGNL